MTGTCARQPYHGQHRAVRHSGTALTCRARVQVVCGQLVRQAVVLLHLLHTHARDLPQALADLGRVVGAQRISTPDVAPATAPDVYIYMCEREHMIGRALPSRVSQISAHVWVWKHGLPEETAQNNRYCRVACTVYPYL